MITFGEKIHTSMMRVIDIVDEDFLNYRKPAMIIGMPNCNFKCCKDAGRDVCHNKQLANAKKIDIYAEDIIKRYQDNYISKSIVFAGLEPLDPLPYDYGNAPYHPVTYPQEKTEGLYDFGTFNSYKSSLTDVLDFIYILRIGCSGISTPCYDDVVIYTGYTKEELQTRGVLHAITDMATFNKPEDEYWGKVIIKYGRFVPDQQPHYDEILGVKLASDNQYAEQLV